MTPRVLVLAAMLAAAAAEQAGIPVAGAGSDPLEVAAAQAAPPQSSTAAEVAAAIEKLSSFEFATRMEAARVIRRAAPDVAAAPLARAARTHADEYVRYRALTLLSGIGGPAAADVMRDVRSDRNDRLRTVAYAWFEHHPDPEVLPALIERLTQERSEFVRPALTRAIAAQGADPRARAVLVPLIARGDDFFRGALIEALGDYGGKYAVAEIAEVAKVEGPLQDDAITAIGRIGDSSMASVLAALQRTAPREVQPTISAALCLLGLNCAAQEEFLRKTLGVAATNDSYQPVLRGAAHALGVLAARGRPAALTALVEAGVPAVDPVRAPLALALGLAALRNPPALLTLLESRADRDGAIELLRDAFDMLAEDYEEERFFVEIRRAYWAAPAGSVRRQVAEAVIQKLEF